MKTQFRSPLPTGDFGRTIARGALINGLGLIGRAMIPVFFILGARLYGTAIMGLFYLAYTMVLVAESIVSSGFNSGTIMFVARYSDSSDKATSLYQVLANSLLIPIGISFLLIGFAHVGGASWILRSYPQEHLVSVVQSMTLVLPFLVTSTIMIAATKGHLTMKWDAFLFGFLRPLLLSVQAVVYYLLDIGINGIVAAYMITEIVVCCIALWVFGRYFSWSRLFVSILRFRLYFPLVRFSVPQSLNTTFNTFITNVDVIMLGYFGVDEKMIFAYGMGAQVVRNIRQVKLLLSEPLGPVIARLHAAGDRDGMSVHFSMVTRWVTSVGLPLAFVVAVLRVDLLRLFDAQYDGSTTFMLMLLVPPLLSVCCGLAGNIVVMTGHSAWNLVNSMTVAVVNVLLNILWIPTYGILGAALATIVASVMMSVMQLIEVRALTGVSLLPGQIYKPYVAVVLPVILFLSGQWCAWEFLQGLAGRIGLASLGVVLFAGAMLLLGVDDRDREILFPFMMRKRERE